MIYLNDDRIPLPLWDALVDSDKDYGEEVKDFLKDKRNAVSISVTSLNSPAQKRILQARHHEETYIEPLKDLWHSMMGNVVHWVLEKYAAKNPRYITEFREGIDIDVDGVQCFVHGKFDLFDRDTGTLQDWKLTSGTNMLYPKDDHVMQLNVLMYILKAKGYHVKAMQDIYLFPHLDKTKMSNELYPKEHCKVVDVPKMKLQDIEDFIRDKLRVHLTEKEKEDKDLVHCTDDERWARGSYFAGYTRKKGGKKGGVQDFSSRAAFKADTRDELFRYMDTNGIKGTDFLIKEFKGKPALCGYCKAAPFCQQRQRELIEEEKENKQQ